MVVSQQQSSPPSRPLIWQRADRRSLLGGVFVVRREDLVLS
jgi:hypothetical protein